MLETNLVLEAKSYVVIDGKEIDVSENKLPDNIVFRDAWALDNDDVIVVDVEKAKEIWKNKMREARETRFSTLDAAYFRALEENDIIKQSKIALQKKYLRDITILPELLNASTVQEIESIWPDILND